MIDKILIAIANALLSGVFKKKPWALWGVKYQGNRWIKIGEGSLRRLRMYEKTLFAEGWRTLICAVGITPQLPPSLFPAPKDSIGE